MQKDDQALTTTTPTQILAQGEEASQKLLEIVKKNGWASNIAGKTFLQFEAWATLARFYGYTVKVTETKYVEYGQAKGFEAKAVVLNSEGLEIGGGESVCMSDEPNWRGKPLYALKSMSQTRACARALRQILSWVAVLAGYNATPAEEMEESFVEAKPAHKPISVLESQVNEFLQGEPPTDVEPPASHAQKQLLLRLQLEGKIEDEVDINALSKARAFTMIRDVIGVKK